MHLIKRNTWYNIEFSVYKHLTSPILFTLLLYCIIINNISFCTSLRYAQKRQQTYMKYIYIHQTPEQVELES